MAWGHRLETCATLGEEADRSVRAPVGLTERSEAQRVPAPWLDTLAGGSAVLGPYYLILENTHG
jgi:hypothetical protein